MHVATDVVEDGSSSLDLDAPGYQRGNLQVAEGLIASALDALAQLQSHVLIPTHSGPAGHGRTPLLSPPQSGKHAQHDCAPRRLPSTAQHLLLPNVYLSVQNGLDGQTHSMYVAADHRRRDEKVQNICAERHNFRAHTAVTAWVKCAACVCVTT